MSEEIESSNDDRRVSIFYRSYGIGLETTGAPLYHRKGAYTVQSDGVIDKKVLRTVLADSRLTKITHAKRSYMEDGRLHVETDAGEWVVAPQSTLTSQCITITSGDGSKRGLMLTSFGKSEVTVQEQGSHDGYDEELLII